MSPGERRTIRVGLGAVLVVAILRYLLVPLWLGAGESGAQLAKERRLLAQELGLLEWVHSAPAQRDSIDAALLLAQRPLFTGLDLNLIAGDVDSYVRAAAEAAPVAISALAITTDSSSSHGVHAVQVVLRGRTDHTGAVDLLRRIESGRRAFTISRMVLQSASPVNVDSLAPDVVTELELELHALTYAVDPEGRFGLARIAAAAAESGAPQ